MDISILIGQRIEYAIRKSGLTLGDAEKLFGISKSALSNYINLHRTPKADFLALLVSKLNVDAQWLLTGTFTRKPNLHDHMRVFRTYQMARDAFLAVEAASLPSQVSGAVLEDIRAAGEALHQLGGMDAMHAAIQNFFPDDSGRTYRASGILNDLWDGIGEWQR
ncbi:helix-turn-helix domain-containing protein [Haematobacter genomosp. 1]|uniref:helix-turn-helix domain-containing protein n=1 Tax=Haematobacter genomosp. 1 TaxID=366618 RepID=UPI0015C5A220|nr:helix-turn-helix transcriptional regulator [Haematobacter genomosp. 1]